MKILPLLIEIPEASPVGSITSERYKMMQDFIKELTNLELLQLQTMVNLEFSVTGRKPEKPFGIG